MSAMKPAFVLENVDLKRNSRLVLVLGLMACTLILEGCAGLPPTAAASSQSSGQHVSIQTALPGSTVGSNYSEVLSVSGGWAPYSFVLSQGQLPPGLVLNPLTGSISGVPTQAGAFTFSITVTGERSVATSSPSTALT